MPRKFVILTSILCQLLILNAQDGIPDWYLNPPKEEGRIFGIGGRVKNHDESFVIFAWGTRKSIPYSS